MVPVPHATNGATTTLTWTFLTAVTMSRERVPTANTTRREITVRCVLAVTTEMLYSTAAQVGHQCGLIYNLSKRHLQ